MLEQSAAVAPSPPHLPHQSDGAGGSLGQLHQRRAIRLQRQLMAWDPSALPAWDPCALPAWGHLDKRGEDLFLSQYVSSRHPL